MFCIYFSCTSATGVVAIEEATVGRRVRTTIVANLATIVRGRAHIHHVSLFITCLAILFLSIGSLHRYASALFINDCTSKFRNLMRQRITNIIREESIVTLLTIIAQMKQAGENNKLKSERSSRTCAPDKNDVFHWVNRCSG